MDLELAADTFCAGFSHTRSFTHPYEFARIGPLRVMRDQPRKSGDYRVEEIIVLGISPEEAVAAIRAYNPARFMLCALHSMNEAESPTKDGYKQRGFRLLHREPMMVRSLERVEPVSSPYPIQRVSEPTLADAVARAAGSRQILPDDIHDGDAKLRLYVALDGAMPIGWVRSIRTDSQCAWVSNMYVHPDYRRKGLGGAIMTAMLQDDANYGAKWSVLLASNAGSKLYPNVGFEQIGLLQVFAPKKDVWGIH